MIRIFPLAAVLLTAACASHPAIHDSLSISDYMRILEARDTAFQAPTGQPRVWVNPGSGLGGTITPTDEPRVIDGRACRQFHHVTRSTDGRTDERTTTACLTTSGVLSVDE